MSDKRVKGDRLVMVVRRGKSEVGAKLKTAMAVIRGFLRGVGKEKEEKNGKCNVNDNGKFTHFGRLNNGRQWLTIMENVGGIE